MIGGVTTERSGRTTLPGLWAAGEVSSTGLHGANRLASNSLVEALVVGYHAGVGASNVAIATADEFRAAPIESDALPAVTEPLDLVDIRNSLTSLMARNVGVRRSAEGLAEAAETIEHWSSYVLPRQFDDPAGWELQNLLTLAGIMVRAARQREESRGVHFRDDFPQTDDARWRRHLSFTSPP
jgi:L-aspartate oxidase